MRPNRTRKRGTTRSTSSRNTADDCPAGYLLRAAARERLGLDESQMRRLIMNRRLVVEMNNTHGFGCYSESQIDRLLAKKHDGTLFIFDDDDKDRVLTEPAATRRGFTREEALKVFALIDQGVPLHKIVLQAELDPRVVDEVRAEYDRLSGSMTIPKAVLDLINRLQKIPASFPLRSPSEILEAMRVCEEMKTCPSCSQRSTAAECGICISTRATEAAKAEMAKVPDIAVYEAIHACIIAIESRPQRTWTRDEIVAHLRGALSARVAAASASTSGGQAHASPASPASPPAPTAPGARATADANANVSQPTRSFPRSSSSPSQ